ncbi:MAG: SPOR domain-containing protein [Methylophilaceae bacterium]
MQKNKTDQGLNFKKRARRRLVGAIAMVFLMVIILPMILEDREESEPREEVEIIMPNQELSDLDVDTEASRSEEVIPDEVETSSQVIALPEVVTPVTNPEPKEVAKPKPEVKKSEVKKSEVKKSEVKKATKPAEVKKAPVDKPTEVVKKSNKFYVQIGVFSDLTNIKKLQSRLSDLGYKSLTEEMTTDTGVKTRLRTETFIGRNEAAIALENIKDSGLTGMVVNQK